MVGRTMTEQWIILVTQCSDCGGDSVVYGPFKSEQEAKDELHRSDYKDSICAHVGYNKVERPLV